MRAAREFHAGVSLAAHASVRMHAERDDTPEWLMQAAVDVGLEACAASAATAPPLTEEAPTVEPPANESDGSGSLPGLASASDSSVTSGVSTAESEPEEGGGSEVGAPSWAARATVTGRAAWVGVDVAHAYRRAPLPATRAAYVVPDQAEWRVQAAQRWAERAEQGGSYALPAGEARLAETAVATAPPTFNAELLADARAFVAAYYADASETDSDDFDSDGELDALPPAEWRMQAHARYWAGSVVQGGSHADIEQGGPPDSVEHALMVMGVAAGSPMESLMRSEAVTTTLHTATEDAYVQFVIAAGARQESLDQPPAAADREAADGGEVEQE